MVERPSRTKRRSDNGSVVIDFGTRAVSDQNFSKIVALPKQALANIGGKEVKRVKVSLIDTGPERMIILTPVVGDNRHDN